MKDSEELYNILFLGNYKYYLKSYKLLFSTSYKRPYLEIYTIWFWNWFKINYFKKLKSLRWNLFKQLWKILSKTFFRNLYYLCKRGTSDNERSYTIVSYSCHRKYLESYLDFWRSYKVLRATRCYLSRTTKDRFRKY